MQLAYAAVGTVPYFKEIAIVLVTSAIVVPLFQRLRTSPVLGFLVAGALVGPNGFALTDDAEGVAALAELGVVFLLFMIGLELSFERLKAMRRLVFGLGTAQVVSAALVIGGVAYFWGNSLSAAAVIGLALALSSTAIVVQVLVERGEIAQRHGRTSFAVLLAQDLAVVPILMLVTVLALPESESGSLGFALALALGKAVAVVVVIILVGRIALRGVYRVVAGSGPGSREPLLAMSLLVVIATAVLTAQAGLSMALGAFLAGLLLAETEYRHQVESDIEPFKGLLLGLFFISVGMNLDFDQVADRAGLVALSVFGLILLKASLAVGLCRVFGQPWDISLRAGLLLSTGGEFAFVIIGTASTGDTGVLTESVGQFMVIVASLSMALTPFLAVLGAWVGRVLSDRAKAPSLMITPGDLEGLEGHVIIAGFGRVGQTAARLFEEEKLPYVALDLNPVRIARFRREGQPVFYGDAAREDVLAKVDASHASALLMTLDDPDSARRAVTAVKRAWPDLPVVARASDTAHAQELYSLGADSVVLETLEASLQLAGAVLRTTGSGRESVAALMDRVRDETHGLRSRLPVSEAPAPATGRTDTDNST